MPDLSDEKPESARRTLVEFLVIALAALGALGLAFILYVAYQILRPWDLHGP